MFRANRIRIQNLKTPHARISYLPPVTATCRTRTSHLQSVPATSGRAYATDAPATADQDTSGKNAPEKKSGKRSTGKKGPTPATVKSEERKKARTSRLLGKDKAFWTTKTIPPEIALSAMYKVLQRLELSHHNLREKLDELRPGPPNPEESASATAKKKDPNKQVAADKELKRQSDSLKDKLKTLDATLNILKDVLKTQEIDLASLTKRPPSNEGTAATAITAPPKTQSKTGSERILSDKPAKSTSDAPNTGSWTSLASRMAQAPAVAAAAVAAGSEAVRNSGSAGLFTRVPADPTPPTERAPKAPAKPKEKSKEPVTAKKTKSKKKTSVDAKPPAASLAVEHVNTKELELTPIEIPDAPEVPKLSYGLDRVLFNPGVYHLQDPHSKVFNFDPYLANIMPLNEFDFNALKPYVTSSKDSTLTGLASKLGKKYTGSTSSMTSTLSHFHYLISSWRQVNFDHLSRKFSPDSHNFTVMMRAPAVIFLKHNEGTYAIDADKEYQSATILSMLGKSMEKLLTLPKEEFELYRRKNSHQISEEERNAPEAFHFTTMGDFLMRSQLDAYDPRLPGSGMFDLKTRCVVSIRMDAGGFQKGLGYELNSRFGQWESFEREYYDMIRAAFLKYSLQVRMGRMDGIFVAYHNTQRIFGFQYVSINEMDQALHGTSIRDIGDQEFKLSVHLLNKVLDRATERFPGRSIRLHFETRPTDPPFMYIFAEPVTEEKMEEIQNSNAEAVAQYEKELLGLNTQAFDTEDAEVDEEDASLDVAEDKEWETQAFWEDMQSKVEEAMEDDALGVNHIRDAIQSALEQSGLLSTRTPEEAREYVNALLEALTRSEKGEELHGTTVIERGTLTVGSNVEEEVSETTEPDPTRTNDPSVGAEQLSQGEAEDTSRQVDETPDAETSSYDPGLKELILQLATRMDEKPRPDLETADDAATSEGSRLRHFGRLLSELVAKSKPAGIETAVSSTPDTSADADAKLSESDVGSTSQTGSEEAGAAKATDETPKPPTELLGMHLTVRSKVNGQYVPRAPAGLGLGIHDWSLEYSLEEMKPSQARKIYEAVKMRRRQVHENTDNRDEEWYKMFHGNLHRITKKGRQDRKRLDAQARKEPVFVMGSEEPRTFEEVFAYKEQWEPQAWDGEPQEPPKKKK
ncbi:hypothetical protein CMUS01_00365 [Colletotrichum musicola]|uniref:Mitochondrial membrane protein n=1 Tax=Colletotrichum musicola TaxID=2175873 RepID=A0A8H6NZ03_9PEZI|nr:hypothetical protein CMUS01_00365 [Colletotrichum musicola]